MPVYKVHKRDYYTKISNVPLRDNRLSLKAKGLLALMLSLPQDWDYSITGFVSICKEGRRSISAAFKELEQLGYVVVEKKLPEKDGNKIDYTYHIYEIPEGELGIEAWSHGGISKCPAQVSSTFCAAQNVQHKTAQKLIKEEEGNPQKIFSSEDESQGDSSSTFDFHVSSGFEPPTVDEVRAFCAANMLDKCDPEMFVAHYAAQGWVLGNEMPMVDWQAAVRKWHINDRNREAEKKAKEHKDDFSDLAEGWRIG